MPISRVLSIIVFVGAVCWTAVAIAVCWLSSGCP
jgi:hypothetical protein